LRRLGEISVAAWASTIVNIRDHQLHVIGSTAASRVLIGGAGVAGAETTGMVRDMIECVAD